MKKADKEDTGNSQSFESVKWLMAGLSLFCVGCLTLGVFLSAPFADVGFSLALAVFLIYLVLVAFSIHKVEKRKRRMRLRQARRAIRKRKSTENVKAQLNRPDFESRLRSFAKRETDDVEEPIETQPVSKMDFWERNEDYALTPTRPIELLRYLLQRISKLVGQGRG